MANLRRPSRDDPFRPSTAPVPAASRSTAPNIAFPQGLHPTASPPLRQQFALAPPAPSSPPMDFGRRRCGRGVPRVRVCCFGDPEMKQRRRVAGYKAYAVEGKVKASIRRGLRWLKSKCSSILRI
ncbi:hypothetical protein QOZ80_1BG0063070 [Eleusine coracana subsp. coracana]|nr:hypothetical protein QOZ80_1BG0063070 [Eleusine coracana subsp. coracana]